MISINFLKETAKKSQTTLINVVREYAQLVFLSAFYKLPGSEKILFKGGTALRLLYKSSRYSEDLDFSAANIAQCSKYENILQEVLVSLEREGFSVEIVESKPTTGGCLAIIGLNAEGTSFPLQTDVSLRKGQRLDAQLTLIESELYSPFTVQTLTAKLLVWEKITALLERQKGRDFYDLYFLIRASLANPVIAQHKEEILNLLDKSDSSTFTEIEPFLPIHQKMLIRQLPKILRSELERL